MDAQIQAVFSRIDPKYTDHEFVAALRSVDTLAVDVICDSQKQLLKLLRTGNIGELGSITRGWTYNSLPLGDALQDLRRMGESKAERLLRRIQQDPGATPHRPLRIIVRTLPLLLRIQQGVFPPGCAPSLNEEMAVAGDSVALFSAWTNVEEEAVALWASVLPTQVYFDHVLDRKLSYLSKKAAVDIARPESVFTAQVRDISPFDEFVSGMPVSDPINAILKVDDWSSSLTRLRQSEVVQVRKAKLGGGDRLWDRSWVVNFSKEEAVADLQSLSAIDFEDFVASFARAVRALDSAPVRSVAETRLGWLSADAAFDLQIWVMTRGQEAYELAVRRPEDFRWEEFDPSHSEEIAELINNKLAERDLEEWAIVPADLEVEARGGKQWVTVIEPHADGYSTITVVDEVEASEGVTKRERAAWTFPVARRHDRKYGYEDPALLLFARRG